MELRQLANLEAVLETGSFAAAAKVRRVAQPALWAQVRALADEWGIVLFERAGRRVRPTAAALALRARLRVLLGDAAALEAEARLHRTGEAGTVRVGVTGYQVAHFLAEAIERFAARWPESPLPELVAIDSARSFEALAEGKVDLVSIPRPDDRFESLPLYWVGVVAVGPRATGRSIDVRRLEGVPLAVFPRAFASRALLDDACLRANVVPRIAFELAHAEGLVALAKRGLATAIIPSEAIEDGVRIPVARLVVDGVPIGAALSLAWRAEPMLSASAKRFRDVIAELAKERAGPRARKGARRPAPPAGRGPRRPARSGVLRDSLSPRANGGRPRS